MFALSLALALSACEELPELPKGGDEVAESTPQWVLDDAAIDALTKNGGIIINWINTADTADTAAKAANTRATTIVVCGPGAGSLPVDPERLQQIYQVYQEHWNTLKRGIEPLPYIYRKAADLDKDYESDNVKIVYDWWWFDEAAQTWKMEPTHEAAGVKLAVDRYWNSDLGQHATGGTVAENAQRDVAHWQSQAAAQTRIAGYKTLYKEFDYFRCDYLTYLEINRLFFSGSMEETLMLDDSNPQKAFTLLLHEMDTYLRSNYVGGLDEDRLFIYEGVYRSGNISSVYFPKPGTYSKADSARQIAKYGKFLDAEKMLESYTYARGQDATYSAVAAARGKLFEFYLGYINGF
ncbi:hypothetical protein AGMMS4957_05790 [Bacteroidia bacterium]|nr:hypothetical protein AGMMS4957_05790 [Bacteroidia bacterium]